MQVWLSHTQVCAWWELGFAHTNPFSHALAHTVIRTYEDSLSVAQRVMLVSGGERSDSE